MSAIAFTVADPSCEVVDKTFFPPQVKVTRVSRTTIATIFGYPEYPTHESNPPKKYHKLTWSGEATQVGNWKPTPETFEWYIANGVPQSETRCAVAKYVYSGFGEIDSSGAQVSTYNKDFYASCPGFVPNFDSNLIEGSLTGYCWPYDPSSCPVCSETPPLVGNKQSNSGADIARDFIGASLGITTTSTTLTQVDGGARLLIYMQHGTPEHSVSNFPPSTWNGISGPWIEVVSTINISAVLSEEYTDAEALSNATVIVSDGHTAENLPRTTGYVSRWTTVEFTAQLSNLLAGEKYTITAHFRDNNYIPIIKQYGLTATAPTASLIDSIPTPHAGGTITLLSVGVSFAK